MKLTDYLVKHKITSRRFAGQIHVSLSAVSKWRMGNRLPRPWAIARIQKATKGKVSLKDWY